MQPKVIAVLPRPMRAFQGWRYFAQSDVPPDLGSMGAGVGGNARAVAARIARSRAAVSLGLFQSVFKRSLPRT